MYRRALGLSALVFVASSVVAGVTVWHAYRQTTGHAREWLSHEISEVPERLDERARCLSTALDAVRGFVAASEGLSPEAWTAYTASATRPGACRGIRGAAVFEGDAAPGTVGWADAGLRLVHHTRDAAGIDMGDAVWVQLMSTLPRDALGPGAPPRIGAALPVGAQPLALLAVAVPSAGPRARWATLLVAPHDLLQALADTSALTIRVEEPAASEPLVDTIGPSQPIVYRDDLPLLGRTVRLTLADARQGPQNGVTIVRVVGLLGLVQTISLTWLVYTLAASRARFAARAAESDASLRREAAETRTLSLVARHAADAILITDAAGRIEWANQAFLDRNGYTAPEVRGQVAWTLLHGPDTPLDAIEAIREALAAGRGCRVETLNYTKDRSTYWVSLHLQPVREPDGALTHFLGIARDITAERQASQQLETSERQYRRIVEQVDQVLFEVDGDLRWTFLNRAWRELTGYELAATYGQSVIAVLHPDDRLHVQELGAAVVRGAQEECRAEVRIITSHGAACWADLRMHALRQDGRLVGVAGTLTDITARRLVQQELERARQAAEQASLAKTEFLRSMSHEMRTPLNGVLGLMELLSATSLDAQQARYVAVARASASHLSTLISDILDLSRIDMGGLQLDRTMFDLPDLVESSLDAVTPEASAKHLRVSCTVTPDVPTWVIGDAGRLRQVLVNLLANAVKFTESGQVHLQADAEVDLASRRATLRIDVQDTGIGLPPDQLERLFTPFSPGDRSSTRRHSGTGLGLTICKRLVDAMQGSIGVSSVERAGATFTVTVPIEVADAAMVESHRSRELPLRVLAVLPDEGERGTVGRLLDGWHFDAAVVPGIDVAWGHLQATSTSPWRFGVVLLDTAVPGVADFARRLQGLSTPPGVVWLTPEHGPIAPDIPGMREQVTRPIKASALFDAIMQAVVTATAQPDTLKSPEWKQAPRVLVADDHEINQLVVRDLLTSMGCQVEVVADGEAALQAVQARAFDVVLMDCQMPVLDGVEATRRLRRAQAEGRLSHGPRVIALTANASGDDRQACLDAGMDAYLTKPVRGTVLQRTLQRLLSGVTLVPPPEPSEPRPAEAEPPMAEAPDAEDILDPAEVLLRCNHNGDLGARMLQLFAESLPGELEALEAAAAANDTDKIGRIAHKMRGAAATLAAVRLAGAITGIELFLKYGDGGPLPDLIADVRHESALFLGVVPQICRRLTEPSATPR